MLWYNSQAITQFAGNEVYGGWTYEGLTIWSLGNQNGVVLNPNQPESVIQNFHVWNVYGLGYYNYDTDHLTFDGLVIRGDWSLMQRGIVVGTGLYSGDYVARNFKVINSDIQGLYVGFDSGITGRTNGPAGGAQVIENTYFRNYLDVTFHAQYSTAGPQAVLPRTTILRNDTFARLNVPDKWSLPPQTYIYMAPSPGGENANYIVADQVYVYNYNGVVGDNFQVYYPQQAADYVLPQTTYYIPRHTNPDYPDGVVQVLGSPVAGLTNAQAWQQYGIAFAGAVAPANATTRSDILGLVVLI